MIGWLPVIAVMLAIAAGVQAYRTQDDESDSQARLVPYALLFTAALLAALSTLLEAVVDRQVGIREASTLSLALLFGTPAVGWAVTRLRWGAPGNRTFHQQISANQASSFVLVVMLVELLWLLGFVVGGTLLGWALGVLAGGLLGGAVAVGGGLAAALVAARRGPGAILESVHARPTDERFETFDHVATELAIAAGIQKPALYVIHADAPNAFAVGLDPDHGTIVVTTGLLELLDREALQGVVAHEIAHLRNFDSRYGLLVAMIVGTVILVAALFASMMSGGSGGGGDGIGGLIVGIVVAIVLFLIGLAVRVVATGAAKAIQASVSREREYLADATSVDLTRNPAGLIRALELISAAPRLKSSNEGVQHLWFVASDGHSEDEVEEEEEGWDWFATHPAPQLRIARLRVLRENLKGAEAGSPIDVASVDQAEASSTPQ